MTADETGAVLFCLDCGAKLGTYFDELLLDRRQQDHARDVVHALHPRWAIASGNGPLDSIVLVGGYHVGEKVRTADGLRSIHAFAIQLPVGLVAIFEEGGSLPIDRLTPL